MISSEYLHFVVDFLNDHSCFYTFDKEGDVFKFMFVSTTPGYKVRQIKYLEKSKYLAKKHLVRFDYEEHPYSSKDNIFCMYLGLKP